MPPLPGIIFGDREREATFYSWSPKTWDKASEHIVTTQRQNNPEEDNMRSSGGELGADVLLFGPDE